MLPRVHRLKKETDIEKLFKKGKGPRTKRIGIKLLPNQLDVSRFVFVVSKKVHKRAYRRNLLRRRVRSIIRTHLSHLQSGLDVAVIIAPDALTATFEELQNDTLHALKKAKILKDIPKL